ncbi:MAG: YciI family protein [Candidatus Dormibacteria bacterium]
MPRTRTPDLPGEAVDPLHPAAAPPPAFVNTIRGRVRRFVVTNGRGPGWDRHRPTREQPGWSGHAAFMDGLVDQGVVLCGGPVGDEERFVLVADAANEPALRSQLGADPWVGTGVLANTSIERWTIWLGADERLKGAAASRLALVRYRPGPDWDSSKPRRQQIGWSAHGAFMDELTERGVVLLGGPLDQQRALLVVRAREGAEALAELAADPWLGRVLTLDSLEPWTLWVSPPTLGPRQRAPDHPETGRRPPEAGGLASAG